MRKSSLLYIIETFEADSAKPPWEVGSMVENIVQVSNHQKNINYVSYC